MGFWLMVILWAVTFTVSELTRPEPEREDAIAATLEEFNFPTTTEGRLQPFLIGTDETKGPNVLWYGDLNTHPITTRITTSLFNTKRMTIGHNYFVGFQMGVGLGEMALRKIKVGGEQVWEGNQTTAGDIVIDTKDLKGTFTFYTGSKTQAVDPYLAQFQSPCPAYRGMCYGVWKGGFVGDSKSIKPWSFEVTRIPTGLGSANPIVNTYDCNPMEFMYELLTSAEVGYGYPDSDINLTEFRAAAATLYTEGNGMSMILYRQKKITQLIKTIEKQIDGRFRIDPATGQWRIVLARDGYSLSGLRDADNSNILEVIDFSRMAWDETVNSVRIQYKRRANEYGTSYAPAQDGANMRIQGGRVVPVIFTFEGVKDDALANKIAWRELRSSSYPLSKGRFKCNRTFWDAYDGEVVLFNYTMGDLTITDLPMRLTRVDVGNKEEPDILVDAVQDVFSWRAASFADPDPTSWTAPDQNLIPFPTGEQLAFEAPYAISRRDLYPSEGRIMAAGQGQGREETGFKIRQRNGSGSPAGDYFDAGESQGFMFIGTVDGDILPDDSTIDILTNMGIGEILETTDFNIGNDLTNLFLIEGEFVACAGVSTITGGLRLTGCYRGLLDSAMIEHLDTAAVYFINSGSQLTDTAFTITYNVDLKLLPFDTSGNVVSEVDAGLTVLQVAMDSRERRPYPPTFLEINGVDYEADPVSMDVQHGANHDTKGFDVAWNRRDYRIFDEVSQNHTDAESIDATFPAANTTEYAEEVWSDGPSPVLLFTTPWAAAGTEHAYRTAILAHLDGEIPAAIIIKIKTRHVFESVTYEALQKLEYEFLTFSTELADFTNMGVKLNQEISDVFVAPDDGTYDLEMGVANSTGFVQARINGGSWVNEILVNQTSGTITGLTAGDTIEVRSNTSLSLTTPDTMLIITPPISTTEGGYCIFALP